MQRPVGLECELSENCSRQGETPALVGGDRRRVTKVFGHQVEQRGAELDDLLVGKPFVLQLSVEALGHRLVAVQVQLLGIFISHVITVGQQGLPFP